MFANFFYRLLLLATLLTYTKQLSLPTDPSYYAGVVEYPMLPGEPADRTKAATQGFIDIIESTFTDNLDILVFPEYVLNHRDTATFVPDPRQNITPCYSPDYEIFLVELSCAARSRGIYVVLNLSEKELCGNGAGAATLNPCPASGVRYFNTNVVLDRRGRVISRYRKTHLWRGEYYKTAVLRQPDFSTFETDFGVTFGHFICFDLLFYEPAMRLLLEHNITDIIYPTFWFSELPFLSAVQLQQGWAFANDINLLAADGSEPTGRTTGSGIYAGRAGRLTAVIQEQAQVQLLKARVPKHNANPPYQLPAVQVPMFQPQRVTQRYTQLATYRDYNVDIFTTQLLDADFLNISQRLCHGDFCCNFAVKRQPIVGTGGNSAYRYRLAAYRGNETSFIRVDRSEQAVCALFACPDEQLLSCGRIFPSSIAVANRHYFESIIIDGVFPAAPRRLIMPSTLDGVMLPLNVGHFNWTESRPAKELSDTHIQLELILPKNDLLTFGIWANYFSQLPTSHNLDHLQPTVAGATGGAAAGGAKFGAACFTFAMWLLLLLR